MYNAVLYDVNNNEHHPSFLLQFPSHWLLVPLDARDQCLFFLPCLSSFMGSEKGSFHNQTTHPLLSFVIGDDRVLENRMGWPTLYGVSASCNPTRLRFLFGDLHISTPSLALFCVSLDPSRSNGALRFCLSEDFSLYIISSSWWSFLFVFNMMHDTCLLNDTFTASKVIGDEEKLWHVGNPAWCCTESKCATAKFIRSTLCVTAQPNKLYWVTNTNV